jgi:hypothetical protein
VKHEHADKILHQAFEHLLDKLELCQRALGPEYTEEDNLRTAVIRACRSSPELEIALFKPARLCEELFADLRSSIEIVLNRSTALQQSVLENTAREQFYVNRRYTGNRRINRQNPGFRRPGNRSASSNFQARPISKWKKKCFVCQKEECWYMKHINEERKRARAQYIF